MTLSSQLDTTLPRRATDLVTRFARNRDGTTAVLFGLMLMPVMVAVGAAVDYSRASDARTQIAAALDSTALAMARRAATLTDAQLQSEGEKHFKAVLNGRSNLALAPISVTRNGKSVRVAASGTLSTSMMGLVGISAMPIGTSAEARFDQRRVEIALVLDNTGSMGWNGKMDELKKATTNLINQAEKAIPAGSDQIKISIVPFETQVRLDANAGGFRGNYTFFRAKDDMPDATKPGLADLNHNNGWQRLVTRNAWTGCLSDRANPFDTNDSTPTPANLGTFHPFVSCNTGDMARILPLTNNWTQLRATVNAMKPGGCTNVTIGAHWGLNVLSPNGPVGAGAPFGAPDVDKYMILLTDGWNTQNRTTKGSCTDANAPAMDPKTKAMCNTIKGKATGIDKDGKPIPAVKVFTVRVIEGSAQLLRDCATTPAMYKEVQQANEIDAVFKDILREILRLRLTV
jgi:Mg-chelatase subunit ChlD